MSDAEENPLEAEEDGETEMEEEEYDTNYYKEVENMQQESKDDTIAWGDSQEEEEEGEEEGEEQEEEEEKREEGEEEEGEEEEETVSASELEEDAGTAQEEVAAGIQEETTAELQGATKSTSSVERLTSTDYQSAMSETFSQTYSASESKHSLQSEHPRSLGSQLEFLGLDLTSSEEQETDSAERWLSDEPGEKTSQMPQDELEQDRGGLEPEGEKKKEKAVSYFIEEKEFQPKAVISEDSLVSTTTEDMLFQKNDSDSVYPLTLSWSFGWNSSLPVYYIRDKNQRVLLYASTHTAVIYNVLRNSQRHLQGHLNVISCLCISEDRRWIATADKGPNSLIIIWDSFTGIPVHTIFDSCPDGSGIRAIAMTFDAKYLATISDAEIQKVCIWRWTLAVETPACSLDLPKEYGFQSYLTFNPTNNKELVSNSKTQAIYYSWNERGNVLTHSAPVLTEKTFNKLVGKFSQSIFHLNLTQVLSATMEGKLVVWDIHRPPPAASASLGPPYIKPCKLVHLQKESITVLTAVDSYIVTGDVKGSIKFYDHTLAIVNWYSHFKLGSIRTLSFSRTPASPPTEKSNYPPDCTLKGDPFVVRNFIIGTADATVYHLAADGTKLDKLFVEPKDAICAISCHPYQPLIAIGSFCGMIKVWNYEQKTYLFSRVFEKGFGVQSLTYNPEGALLGAGFTEGTVYILDAMSLENEISEPFKYSRTNVTHISFSHDSQYMATADASFTVAVYKVRVRNGQRVWEYLARLRSHRQSIRSLLFGVHLDSNEPRLLSLGKDRLLIEYNLLKSCRDHLEVLDIHQTDQGNYPTCMIWYPPLTKELFMLVCNSGYKVKLFNSTTKMCRKTLLGPVYGSPIEQIQILPVKTAMELQKRYLVFINRDKVGLQILPVDGNPHKTSAIICHPDGVAGMALSCDGRYAFTAGGQDRSVIQWEINLSALEAAVSLGGEGLTPFYSLVSGGREGKFYRELEDYFYYSQLRGQGIDTMETRKVSEHICLSELPFVMRAIGFYPSEEKIEDMFNEIRFSEYVDSGEIVDKINLPDFLKVYLNHRPPFGNTMYAIERSFNILGYTNSKGKKVIRREDFLKLLLTKGEHMTEEELSDCLATLLGLNPEGWKSEPAAASTKVVGMSPTSSRRNLKVFTNLLEAHLSCRRTAHLLLLVHRRNEDGPEVWGANVSSGGTGPDPSPGPACVGMTPVTAWDAGLRTPWWPEDAVVVRATAVVTMPGVRSKDSQLGRLLPFSCCLSPISNGAMPELSSRPGYPIGHFQPAARSSCTCGGNVPIVMRLCCDPRCLETVTSALPCSSGFPATFAEIWGSSAPSHKRRILTSFHPGVFKESKLNDSTKHFSLFSIVAVCFWEMLLRQKPNPFEDVCFLVRLGSQLCLEDELPDEITAEIFATEILGLALSSSSRREPTDHQ